MRNTENLPIRPSANKSWYDKACDPEKMAITGPISHKMVKGYPPLGKGDHPAQIHPKNQSKPVGKKK